MSKNAIPFNRPHAVGTEFTYISEAISSMHLSGDGRFTEKCRSILEAELPGSRVLLTTSCTHALEMSALLINIREGDEVILPSFTFVSTANAFVLRGAKPIFADIRPDTLNLDERLIVPLISPRTRAIVPVHYAGVACEMDTILKIAAEHCLEVIEDNAHGIFGKYRGRSLGTFGGMATLSFHETKNFSCGEGGALIINDAKYFERAEIIREKGTNRSKFFRGEVEKYTWVDLGSSYLPSDILAAFLFAQLEARQGIQEKRHAIFNYYLNGLKSWAAQNGVQLPTVPGDCEPSYYMFHLVMPSLSSRQGMIDHLNSLGIQSVFHYLPLHLSPFGRRFVDPRTHCPVTEEMSDRLLRLPFHHSLSGDDLARVVDGITRFEG